jgi:predicted transcriptional regulator
MMKRKGITPAEVTLLRYILDNQPVTVRQVADYMTEQHGLARTTVLTHMERLRKRHILERTEVDGIISLSAMISQRKRLRHWRQWSLELKRMKTHEPFLLHCGRCFAESKH